MRDDVTLSNGYGSAAANVMAAIDRPTRYKAAIQVREGVRLRSSAMLVSAMVGGRRQG